MAHGNFGHFYKISDKSEDVHTADLGYLGFQDYHINIFSSVAAKLREATPPVTSCNRSIVVVELLRSKYRSIVQSTSPVQSPAFTQTQIL